MLERIDRIRVALRTKVEKAEVPPAILPIWPDLERCAIIAGRIVEIARIPCLDGIFRQLVEAGRARGRRDCVGGYAARAQIDERSARVGWGPRAEVAGTVDSDAAA